MLLSSALRARGRPTSCAAASSEAIDQTEARDRLAARADRRAAARRARRAGPRARRSSTSPSAARPRPGSRSRRSRARRRRARSPAETESTIYRRRSGGAHERGQARAAPTRRGRGRRARTATSRSQVARRRPRLRPRAPTARARAWWHARARRARGRRASTSSRGREGPTSCGPRAALPASYRGQLRDRRPPASSSTPGDDQVKRVDVAARRERAGPHAAADEQDRRRRRLGDLRPRRPEALLRQRSDRPITSSPAPAARLDDALAPALGDDRLGRDAGVLLHEQAGVAEQARTRLALLGLARRAEQLQRRAGRRRDPRAQLERRPVVLGAAERHDHAALGARQRPARPRLATSTATSHAASLQHRADVAARDALAEQRAAAVDQQQVDLLGSSPAATRSAPGSAETNATPRAATPWSISSMPRQVDLARRLARAAGSRSAARRVAAARRGGRTSRARISSRGGSERASGSRERAAAARSAVSVCGATRIDCSGTATSGNSALERLPRLLELLLDRRAVARSSGRAA